MFADMHVHSTFSFDADDDAETLIKQAVEIGLPALAITDHLDVNEYENKKYKHALLIPEAERVLPALKEKYAGQITVLHGIELGQSVHDKEKTLSLITGKPYDVILGSVHAVRGEPDFYYIDYKSRDCVELLDRYFGEIFETVQWGGIDIIAHLTYTLRYINGHSGIDYPTEKLARHDEIIDETLRLAAAKNIGLEINTGGLRAKRYGSFDPPLKYIKRFKELGGEIITLGSDAHRASDLGKGLKEAAELAKAAGFDKAAYFAERKPYFYKI